MRDCFKNREIHGQSLALPFIYDYLIRSRAPLTVRRQRLTMDMDRRSGLTIRSSRLRQKSTFASSALSSRTVPSAFLKYSIIITCLAIFGCGKTPSENQKPTQIQSEATATQNMLKAINEQDWDTAQTLSRQVLIANPDDPELITKVALVTARTGNEREAAKLLVTAAKAGNFRPASRVDDAVQGLINVGEIYDAVQLLEESLKAYPNEHQQRRTLVGFLSELQRTEKLPEHLQVLFQARQFDLPLLFATTDTSTRRLSVKTIETIFERNPEDYRVKLGNAFLLLYQRSVKQAGEVLEEILEHHPDFAPAYAIYGRVLATQSRWSELQDWYENAPKGCDQYPDYWVSLGDLANEQGSLDRAIRGYWEACRCAPSHSLAWNRLAIAIQRIKSQQQGDSIGITNQQIQLVTKYSEQLQSFREQFNHFAAGQRTSQSEAMEIAVSLLELGRSWSAEAWWAIASTLRDDPAKDLQSARTRIIEQLRADRAWQSKTAAVFKIDYDQLPMPDVVSGLPKDERVRLKPASASTESLRLTERSLNWGLEGYGADNSPDEAKLAPLIRSTGVGGGSIDIDLDGRPDLMIMNAAGSMLKLDSKPNNLLRNVGGHFTDISKVTGVGHTGFGQGVAIGDFNEDGFPDLFFANLGSNRLLRNNGDGSFTDCSDHLVGDLEAAWSSSASFVDINNDSITDLFVTNYCKPVENIVTACPDDEGKPGPCHPLRFPADVDMVFQGKPDGTFVNITDRWIQSLLPGRGLGIVSGQLVKEQLGIFVANDMSRNAYYTRGGDDGFGLTESAGLRGVALDGMSRAQASMGIASCDFDHDGDLDFYVTGFGREYNVYYEQVAPGLWKDETSRLGLVEPTLPLIGFGAQPIDIDSDGVEEIIVTNGHIGDFDSPDVPDYDLPLQIFRRNQEGKFDLLDDDPWGEYFELPHVGRALWTSDINVDGRNDVFITHMNEQIRLLLNESTDTNHRIGFRLVATDCSRDAVGAVVRFSVGNETRTAWMLSGDGYFCSNEKTLITGLSEHPFVTEVEVTWADGTKDNFGTLDADHCHLLVQGSEKAFQLSSYSTVEE